jgi:hypothetical protein
LNQLLYHRDTAAAVACLVGRTADEQSPDPRYCQGCYDFLLQEIEINPKGSWKPKKPGELTESHSEGSDKPYNEQETATNPVIEEIDMVGDVIVKIQELATRGKSTRQIAAMLQDRGLKLSHMTIARRLQGIFLSVGFDSSSAIPSFSAVSLQLLLKWRRMLQQPKLLGNTLVVPQCQTE